MLKHVSHVEVYVSNLDASIPFYRDKLGLRLAFRADDHGWAEFETEGAALALSQPSADQDAMRAQIGGYTGIVFTVDDCEAAYKELSARGVNFPVPPRKEPWGGTLAVFQDPDQNKIFIVSR